MEEKNIFSTILEFIYGVFAFIFVIAINLLYFAFSIAITIIIGSWVLSWFGIHVSIWR